MLSAQLTLQGGEAGNLKKPAKATERIRRVLEGSLRGDDTATEVANNSVRKLQGASMGKAGKFELSKGPPAFDASMDLLRYLEDNIFPKVRQPEGGAELHQPWQIYKKAKQKFGLQPPVSITKLTEQDFDMADADMYTLLSIMGGDSNDDSEDLVTLGGKANLAVGEAKWPSTKIAPFSRVHLSGSVVRLHRPGSCTFRQPPTGGRRRPPEASLFFGN